MNLCEKESWRASITDFLLLEQMNISFCCFSGAMVSGQLEIYFLDLGALTEIQFSKHLLSAYQVWKVKKRTRHPLSSKGRMSECPEPV